MEVYKPNKKEKIIFLLTQENYTTWFRSYFATQPVSCPLILKLPQKSECFQQSKKT